MTTSFVNPSELINLLCNEWREVLNISGINWAKICSVLNNGKYYPNKHEIFNALNHCRPNDVKVVVIGQDPYFNVDQAHGYSFSVRSNVTIPPSLNNIFKELMLEYNIYEPPPNGNLESLASEGVLLLNSILTVAPGKANSHKGIGWEQLTSEIIKHLNKNKVIYLAWGSAAAKICKDAEVNMNNVIKCGHPSPLNTINKFIGCNCFRRCNELLMQHNVLPIRWDILWHNDQCK